MHKSIFAAESKPTIKRCTSCCRLYHCPLCPTLKPTRLTRIQRHLEGHLKNAIIFNDKRICRCNLYCRTQGHYHCPLCCKTILRRNAMEAHLQVCTSEPFQISPPSLVLSYSAPAQSPLPSSRVPAPSPLLPTANSQRTEMIRCPHCSLMFLKNNLDIHITRQHTEKTKDITSASHLSSVCIDATNGLSAVQRVGHDLSVPVHVQKKTWGKIHHIRCELEECWQYQLLAKRNGQPFDLCEHLRSLDYCTETASEELLKASILDEMVCLKIFGDAKKSVCLKRQKAALASHVPFSVLVAFGDSNKLINLSIHEPTIHHYSRLSRVMVTYDYSKGTWHCPCAKPRKSCPHKNIAKWHLFQTNHEIFRTEATSYPDSRWMPQLSSDDTHALAVDLSRTVQYVYDKKKLPAILPDEVVRARGTQYLTSLLPMETTCTFCAQQTTLENPVQITTKAQIVTITGVIHDVSTYTRRCPVCHVIYRYQEWQDGLHNFDDYVLLSLELCLYIRHSLQNHISVSRAINTLEGLRGMQYPSRDVILHAYCHFEALTDIDYTYLCVNCGYYPPVIVMDLHKTSVFKTPVRDLKQPTEFGGVVDIEDFWRTVHLEIIANGFVSSRAKNPFAVNPSYEKLAPWIGKKTRIGHTVLNTEHEKIAPAAVSAEAKPFNLSEDHLVDELMKQKVGVIRNLCRACNVDSKGSQMDLILRLKAQMQNRQSYDKIFQKISGASDGWSVILCPHGIAYSLKFNFRAESPRDYTDLLLSWKHLPNVSIYNFADGLATHGNLRAPSATPFQPHEGRLAESTAENINLAMVGKLKVSLPWLKKRAANPNPNAHPITGSSDHYVLYDKLHASSTKDPQDILRKIDLVPELQGVLNCQIVERFFASLRKNNYFLNNMAASTHMFIMRNIVHHKNTATNKKLLELQLQPCHMPHENENITLSDKQY